jgi:hypothetical protein
MRITMNQKKIKALAAELAKDLKTSEDLSALSAQVMKIAVEAARFKTRGVEQTLIACVDGLTGFPDTKYKLCIISF